MTVSDYLAYLGRLRGMKRAKVRERLPLVLDRTGLTPRANDAIDTLSLGFRKRVGIAQAIIHDPSLLILDEPISGLDPVQIVEMRELIKSLGGDHTILISSHILSEVEETCDYLLVLNEGELVASGTEEEVLASFTQSLRFEIAILGDFERAGELLAAHPLVTEIEDGRVRADVGYWTVKLEDDSPAQLAQAIVEAGLGLHRLEPARGQLESAFLSLTGAGGLS